MRLTTPVLGAEEAEEVARVLATGYLTQGPRAAEFERAVASRVGSRHGFATSSATTGLHLALHALRVGPGDEVVMPAYSFPATANVVAQSGAIPVLVDIEPATFNLDPALLEAAISPRSVALLPVHAFGLCADMDPILEVAKRHQLPVLEDAACAMTATYRGREAGTMGTLGVYSFHPRKIITTGEGGVVVTDDDHLAEMLAVLRSHGSIRNELYLDFVEIGFNYRLSDVHAAIGLVQLRRLEHVASERRALALRLSERLRGLEGVKTPSAPDGHRHSYQSYVVLLDDDLNRDAVIRAMRANDVETTLGTYGMHLQPVFAMRYHNPRAEFPHASRAHDQALTLPLYPGMSDTDLDVVSATLAASIAEVRG